MELIWDFATFYRKHVRDTWYIQHFTYLRKLFDIDVIEDDLSSVTCHCLLHNWTKDLAWTTPRGRALEYNRNLAINDFIPLSNVSHSIQDALSLFLWSSISVSFFGRGIRLCTETLLMNALDLKLSKSLLLFWFLAKLGSRSLLLDKEVPHLCLYQHLALSLVEVPVYNMDLATNWRLP